MARKYNYAQTKEYYIEHYVNNDESAYHIANLLGVSPIKVYNDLKHYEIPRKNRKECQQISVAKGRHICPTRGRKRTDVEKQNIGKALTQSYQDKPAEYKEKLSNRLSQRYKNMTEDERANFHQRAAEVLKKTSLEGSRLEKFLTRELRNLGYRVEQQRDMILRNQNLRIDLFLQDLRLAIEVDGVFHRKNIYNETDKFHKRLQRDNEKNGLLLSAGYAIIRIYYPKKMSESRMRLAFEKILPHIEKVKNQFPPESERLIFIEEI